MCHQNFTEQLQSDCSEWVVNMEMLMLLVYRVKEVGMLCTIFSRSYFFRLYAKRKEIIYKLILYNLEALS
jgi:hypothetical protein